MKRCAIEGCEGTIKPGSKLTTCTACYQYQRRWDQHTSSEVLEFRHKLTVRHARLTRLVPATVRELKRPVLTVPVRERRAAH